MNTHPLQFHVMAQITGPHLSCWKSGSPSWAVCMSASWRKAPSTAALCSLIRREHRTRAQGMARNQTKLYQILNYSKRTNMPECEHTDGWNGCIPGPYISLNAEVQRNFSSSQTIFFANCQLNGMVQLIQWVWIIISGFRFFGFFFF